MVCIQTFFKNLSIYVFAYFTSSKRIYISQVDFLAIALLQLSFHLASLDAYPTELLNTCTFLFIYPPSFLGTIAIFKSLVFHKILDNHLLFPFDYILAIPLNN